MNWEQLRAWVNDPARTTVELDNACAGLGLATGGTLADMRTRLRLHIQAQPDMTAASPWTPPTGTAATAPAGATAAAPPPPATPPPAVPAGAPAPAAAAPAPAPTPVAAATPPPVHHGWRERFTGDGGGLLSVGAIVLTAFVLWLVIWGIDWDNPFSDDEGVQVITTDAATPVAGDDGESVSLLDDPRVVEIRERIESGEIKTVDDLQSAVEDADFNEEEWIQIREELAPNGQLVAPAPSNGSATGDSAQVSAWPTSPAEAAAIFGGTPNRWETTAEGGWHMREEPFSVLLNPRGFLAEGYFDTKPGRNPQCFAFVVPMGVQGATVWQEEGTLASATALQMKMAVPKWDDGSSNHPCEVMAQ